MRSNQFKSIIQTASSISNPNLRQTNSARQNLAESTQNIFESASQEELALVESISEILVGVEKQLGIKLSEQEISEATNFILEESAQNMIIEAIQNDVGFELNEEEIKYILNELRG